MEGYREVELKKMKRTALVYVEEGILASLADECALAAKTASSTHTSFIRDELVLRVVQEIWGRELSRVDVEWPADWWQAVKERWLPAWAKGRWPVKMRGACLVARELYPKMAMPDMGPLLRLDKRGYLVEPEDEF